MGNDEFHACMIRSLPEDRQVDAAMRAIEWNPVNRPALACLPDLEIAPSHLAVLTSKYWGSKGVKLTVAFMEATPSDLRDRIIAHMNAWGEFCNVKFMYSTTDPQVRISRGRGGYWSYLGVDILSIPRNQPTMNLEGFTMQTSEREFIRVVRHETGHTLGFPHEHLRKDLVELLDVQKTIAYFSQTQGWSASEVRRQVLTPLEESTIMGTGHADGTSIMCYRLPGSITKSGQPIVGGDDIDQDDRQFASQIYPLSVKPPVVPPSGGTRVIVVQGGVISLDGKTV